MLLQILPLTASKSIVAAGSQTAPHFWDIWVERSWIDQQRQLSIHRFANRIFTSFCVGRNFIGLVKQSFFVVVVKKSMNFERHQVFAPAGITQALPPPKEHIVFRLEELERCDTVVYFSFFHEAAFQGPSMIAAVLPSWNWVWMKLAAAFVSCKPLAI